MALSLALAWATAVHAAPGAQQPVVRVVPEAVEMEAGETAPVQVVVEGALSVYGYQFILHFDPTLAEVVDADNSREGVQIGQGSLLSGDALVPINRVDNLTGRVEYVATLLGPGGGRSGSGTLGTMTFKAKANGRVALRLSDVRMAAPNARSIALRVEDGARAPSAEPVGGRAEGPTDRRDGATGAATPANEADSSPVLGLASALATVVAVGALASRRLASSRRGGGER